jgi:catechol 2,3-dioxygenase-like lactoylglutathione lyase family enzyme
MDPTLFKTGFLVTDLDGALRDFSRWLGVTWTPVQQSKLVLDTGAGREEVELRFAYTTGSPPYLELLEAQPRGYYAAPAGAHLHHVGRWVDDLAAASRTLAAAGLPLEAAGVDAAGRSPSLFAFHRGPHGLRIELVDRAMQPGFETWLAGGELALP